MKVKKLIKELKKCGDERLLIEALDEEGRSFPLAWNYLDDGPDWERFSLVVKDGGWPRLDTDMAKAMLNHAFHSPDNINRSLFWDEGNIAEYKLSVTWPCNRNRPGCGWETSWVKKIRIVKDLDGKRMVLYVEDLPHWNDSEYDQEELDRRTDEINARVQACMEAMRVHESHSC